MQLIFFDGEEAFVSWTDTDSIYGARHLAKRWASERLGSSQNNENRQSGAEEGKTVLEGIDVLVLLDLLGAPDPVILNRFERTTKIYERLQRIEGRLRKQELMNIAQVNVAYFPSKGKFRPQSFIGDDHAPFLERGVPVVHAIPFQFPPVWHTAEDNEQAVDLPTLDDLGRIMKVFVCEYLDV